MFLKSVPFESSNRQYSDLSLQKPKYKDTSSGQSLKSRTSSHWFLKAKLSQNNYKD
jgi:hypothetical protein